MKGFHTRLPVLSFLGGVFAFMLFPIGIGNLALEQMFKIREKNNRAEIAVHMNHSLRILKRFSDNEFFTHFLLFRLNKHLLSVKDPGGSFEIQKKRLQRKYPGAFSFVFWDEKGNIRKDISDEVQYRYILKKTFAALNMATQIMGNDLRKSRLHSRKNLTDLEEELQLLRPFLGKLLVTDKLRLPLSNEENGRPLQVKPSGPGSYIWYRMNAKFGMLCFIDEKFIKSKAGIDYAIRRLATRFPDFSFHISDFPASARFYPEADSRLVPQLIQALSRFENMGFAEFEEFRNLIVGCEILNQKQRAVCCGSSSLLFRADVEHFKLLGMGLRIFLPLLFVFAVWFQTRCRKIVTVRLKVWIIFMYAGGMPLLILVGVGYGYLDHKKQQMIFAEEIKGANTLYQIDRDFEAFLVEQAKKLNGFCSKINDTYGNRVLRPEILAKIRRKILEMANPDTILVFNEKGESLVEDVDETILTNYSLLGKIAKGMIAAANMSNRVGGAKAFSRLDGIAINNLSKKREIGYVGLGSNELYQFFDFIGEPKKYKNLAMVQLGWRFESLQKDFFSRYCENLYIKDSGVDLTAFFPGENRGMGKSRIFEGDLKKIVDQTQTDLLVKTQVFVDSNAYLVVALKGLHLNKIVLLYILPLKKIEQFMDDFKMKIVLLIICFLLLSSLMAKLLVWRLIKPLKNIEKMIENMKNRDFSSRLNLDSCKEFTLISNSFNETFETLRDLEVARIVQENLFPTDVFSRKSFNLSAFSRPFSRIGGDYYDYFPISENSVCIFIGDVSGHGVAAALIMAMAKAVMTFEKKRFSTAENLINLLDQIIYKNRRVGTKEYMTGLLVILNDDTGELEVINRGHCKPIHISEPRLEHIECGGVPLGFNMPQKNATVKLFLKPGDLLCLYTDGMAEAKNENGELLGYDGFLKMLEIARQDNNGDLLEKVKVLHQSWSAVQDDDQTVILLKRECH